LKPDLASVGLCFALCQPADDALSLAAMKREDNGSECEFERVKSKLRLHPVAFGGRKSVGNEKHFHSHPGESLAAAWAAVKNRHFLWGRTLSLLSDCRAIMWLMNYKGHNHAIMRLQLEMAGYWFTTTHRSGTIADADYFSHLGADIHIDPLLVDYISFIRQLYITSQPLSGPITKDNMPGRRTKIAQTDTDDDVILQEINLANVMNPYETASPTMFETDIVGLVNVAIRFTDTLTLSAKSKFNNAYVTTSAMQYKEFGWCLHEPRHGHFIKQSRNLAIPFQPILICDSDQASRSTMLNHHKSTTVRSDISQLLLHIKNEDLPTIDGYYGMISNTAIESETHLAKQHVEIVLTLQKKVKLKILILEVTHLIRQATLTYLTNKLEHNMWVTSVHNIDTAKQHYCDSVAIQRSIVLAIKSQYFPEPHPTWPQLYPTPTVDNSPSQYLNPSFDTAQFALENDNNLL
jgi:hypothetical protein